MKTKQMKKIYFLLLMLVVPLAMLAQINESKTYTIRNSQSEPGISQPYMQDNSNGSQIDLNPMLNENSYWKFVPTGNTDCYYIQNAKTGKYIQGYSVTKQKVAIGDNGVEYYIKADETGECAGCYRMTCTANSPHDFSDGTLGLNWKGDNENYVQSYASKATDNKRSTWIITEAYMFLSNKKYALKNYAADGYLKDDRSGTLRVEDGLTSNALWTLVSTGNENYYYIKNLLTGKYIQKCTGVFYDNSSAGIEMADNPVEFKVGADTGKGNNVFAFASNTDENDFSFSGNMTRAINWRDGSNYAQGFLANTGGNPRSFWKVAEVQTVDFTDNADNSSAISAAAGEGKNAVVTRTVANGMWNTLVVPHAMNARAITRNFGEGAKVAALTSEAGGVLKFSTVTGIVAGKPYLVKPTIDVVNIITMNTTVAEGLTTDGGDSYKFVGLYAPATIGTDDYFMATENTLMKNGAGGKMKAFRAYFQANSNQVKALVGFSVDETETGIIAPNGTIYEDTRIFNLAGQQVNLNNTRKGIFIINGKKVVVK